MSQINWNLLNNERAFETLVSILFSKEFDLNIKEFMKWRWEGAKKELKEEELRKVEEDG